MMALWNEYVAWFDARNARERTIVGVAVIASLLMLGADQWIWPAVAKARALSTETEQNVQTVATTKLQLAQLEQQLADPDAAARARLEQLRKILAEQEPMLRNIEASLVPADRMAQFLKSLLARNHSLQLLSLKTLPPVPADGSAMQDASAANAGTKSSGASLYKHGVEITLSGNFADLVGYLSDLENAPQKIMWGRLDLQTTEYPRSAVTLTVYTLSLDRTWLVI